MSEVTYHPHFGAVRPNGTLKIPISGRSEGGEAWNGETEVGPDHPSYESWRHAIAHKEQHLTAQRESRMQAREALRRAAEWKRTLKQREG